MYTEALGRTIDVVSPADDVYVSLREASGVTFIVTDMDAASAATITFAANASGTGAVTPDVIDHYYGRAADVSSGVWHRTAVSPASETFTKSATTEDCVVIEVSAMKCPDGKPYVKCTLAGTTGQVVAVLHDLAVQRTPSNLASRIA